MSQEEQLNRFINGGGNYGYRNYGHAGGDGSGAEVLRALWRNLAAAGGRAGDYCPPCIPKMAQIPFRGMKKTSVAYLNRTDEESQGAIEGHCAEILAFCPEGGNA